MSQTVQAGTILIKQPLMTQSFGLESEPYFGGWGVVKAFDSLALERKIHAAGWHFFFLAAEARVIFFGTLGTQRIQNALQRILAKVRPHNFNCLEVTEIVAKRFLGVPYTVVSAHSRHLQKSCYLGSAEERPGVPG